MNQGIGPHLTLFGRLGWQFENSFEPIPFGRPALVVVVLADRQPGWVSVGELVDLLWEDPPRGATNALQRHVSRLRKHLRRLGLSDVSVVLESSAAGYRLAPGVATDVSALAELLDCGNPAVENAQVPTPGSGAHPQWWTDPLTGSDWDGQRLLRSTLEAGAHQLRDRWVTQVANADQGRGERVMAAEFLTSLVRAQPDDELAALALLAADPPRGSTYVDYRQVGPVAAAWSAGQPDRALELLAGVAGELTQDVRRRLERCVRAIDPSDAWALVSWSDLVGLPDLTAELAEKMLVSLDAYALEQTNQGLRTADEEVARAQGEAEVVRALRVRFMIGLGHPLSSDQIEIPERLATIDDVDAQTEALRYRGMLAAKTGEFDRSLEWFGQYAELRARVWPNTVDDFDQLARFILGQARRGAGEEKPVVAASVLPIMTNQIVVDMTLLWVYLNDGTRISEETITQMLRSTVSSAQPECGLAFELLRLLTLQPPERPDDGEILFLAQDLLERVRIRPRNRNQHVALVVMSRVACLLGDEALATSVLGLLRPWAGEQLGVWPMDLVIGPADEVIDDLETMLAKHG